MILITGDTHREIDLSKLSSESWPYGQTLTKDDYLIITGDFGLVWDATAGEIQLRKWLNDKPWTTLFIDGNHENFDMLEEYPTIDFMGGKASQIMESIFWLRRGEVFEIDNKKIFVFGGATSRDRDRRIPGKSWWFQEVPNYRDIENAEKNLGKHNWKVDYVISHTAPYYELQGFLPEYWLKDYNVDPTTMMLQEFKDKLKFKHWYFGHLHDDRTIGRFTTLYDDIVNAQY